MEKFTEIAYERPDVNQLVKRFKESFKALKNSKNFEDADKAYINMQNQFKFVETMFVTAKIRSDINVKDKFYEKEMRYLNSVLPRFMLLINKIGKELINSPFKKDFENKYGLQMFRLIDAELKTMNWKILLLLVKEANLGQKYSKTVASAKTKFNNEESNFYNLLKYMESTDRNVRKNAFKAWADMYEGISGKLDDIYEKSVNLRKKMAKRTGFKDYIEMSYIKRNRFDYSISDVEKFRQSVKEYIVPQCEIILKKRADILGIDKIRYYDEFISFKEGNPVPKADKNEFLELAQKMYSELSDETGEFFDFMRKYELFDLYTKPDKHMGGYCTFLSQYDAPFIFSNFNGTSADIDVLTHEAGHAFEIYTAAKTQPITDYLSSTSEINEIHSMAMEHFTYPWMELFFQDQADKYRYAHLSNALCVIPYIVCVDEFQHKVYSNNNNYSSKEIRHIWRDLEKQYMPWRDYDGNSFLEEGGFWMQKQHIFLYPFYYLEYSLAQICAFELYSNMKKNRSSAWEDYYRLCKSGGSKGYFELLEIANLKNPLKPETVRKVVEEVTEELMLYEKGQDIN